MTLREDSLIFVVAYYVLIIDEMTQNIMKSLRVLSFVSLFIFTSSTDISELAFGNIDDAVPAAYGL